MEIKGRLMMREVRIRRARLMVLTAALAAFQALSLGCGDDGAEGARATDVDGGAVRQPASDDNSATKTALAKIPDDFVASCHDEQNNTCSEYAGATRDADKIEMFYAMVCDGAAQTFGKDRCPTDELVASCVSPQQQGAAHRLKRFFYSPTTEESAMRRCVGSLFEAAD